MNLFLSTALLSLVLNANISMALNDLLRDLLQEYPSYPNCSIQYITDKSFKLSSFIQTSLEFDMKLRALTLWDVSHIQKSFPNDMFSSSSLVNCEMVLVDANRVLAMDFIKHIHSKGLLGQNLFYAMKLESVEILYKRNITEIYDFSHLIFLVDKVTE